MNAALERFFSLADQVAIVTGASRGLGLEIARTLALAGARLVVNGQDESRLKASARSLADDADVEVVPVAGDIAQPGVADALVAAALDLGRLDILVNNAGINVRGAIDHVTPDDFDRVIGVNVRGPWLLCRAAAPIFRQQKRGRVINVASTLGLVARSDRSLYCSSKGAIVQLTRELAVEWAPFSVTVNAVCPGPFKTEMNRVLLEDPVLNNEFAGYTAMRRWGEPGELGPAVLFLASPAASYITGAILPVDGGWVVKS
jgi:NAD(P)-dependent dehydrogenase (short-subunit alcohol dehydrogenase family)